MTPATQQLLSQVQYALHRSVSRGAVQKAIKSGRLARSLVTGDDGVVRIDAVIADSEWASNTDPAMQRKPSSANSPAVAGSTKTPPAKQKPPAEVKGAVATEPAQPLATEPVRRYNDIGILEPTAVAVGIGEVLSMADARARKEHFFALQAELDYKLKAGQLIEAETARNAISRFVLKAKRSFLVFPDRLAAVLVGVKDEFECRQTIEREVRNVLQELSRMPIDAHEVGNAG